MNTQRHLLAFAIVSSLACSAAPEDDADGLAPSVSNLQQRTWRRLGAAPASHNTANESPDPATLRRASRLGRLVTERATLLDGDGGEFAGVIDRARVAANVAAYDRERAEGPVQARERIEAVPDPLGVRQNIQGSSDNRTRVSTGSLDNAPFKYIGRYEIPVTTHTISTCTGTLIGSRYVAIAAHCVYDRHDDAWIYGYNSTLGIYRGKFCIDGVCANVSARKMSPDWAGAGDLHFREHDYALLKLDSTLGTTNGTMARCATSTPATTGTRAIRPTARRRAPPTFGACTATSSRRSRAASPTTATPPRDTPADPSTTTTATGTTTCSRCTQGRTPSTTRGRGCRRSVAGSSMRWPVGKRCDDA
jgi:V8-like Glu-specific endopeptidase